MLFKRPTTTTPAEASLQLGENGALISLRERETADIALYVGDDVTDEDVFELDQPGRLLCIRVGQSRKSAAPWFLRDQREIDMLLKKLVELRAKGHVS